MKKILFCILICLPVMGFAQQVPYLDYKLPLETRVNDLVSRMTPEEKAGQLLYTASAIPRLGIPEYNWWNEALHGVARAGYATVFPQSITIADSWDESLMLDVANAISDEARAKYHEAIRRGEHGIYQGLTFWSPNINLLRDPRWGRGHETYGEDPYLTGRMGLRFVQGMQGSDPRYLKTVATAKHYAVHSGPEPLRHRFNAIVSDRDLRESYLPAFRTLVKEGNVTSVMGAYNMFRGVPCCANNELYGILRNEWGFRGYIVSDCWAISDFYTSQKSAADPVEAAAMALKAGTDLECGVDFKHLQEALKKGLITEEDLDRAVKRIFTARFRLGMFDPDSVVEYAQIPYSVNCSDYNRNLARKAARESMVLLKNDNKTLPLSKRLRTIAVIGPNADNIESLTGNYNGVPKSPVTVLEGIRHKVEPDVKVIYAEGSDLADGVHNMSVIPPCYLFLEDGKNGVEGSYYNNQKLTGNPAFIQTEDNIDFQWDNDAPALGLKINDFGVHWVTYLVPPVSGTYYIGASGISSWKLLVNGQELSGFNSEHQADIIEKPVELKAGEKYRIDMLYHNMTGAANIKLLWSQPKTEMIAEAIAAAEKSDAVIAVVGLSQRLEGEEMDIKIDGFSGGDRTSFNLPACQEEMLKAVMGKGKPVIVILMTGGPVSSELAQERADAVLLAGYPGVEGGDAVADVLFGDYNPAGRLPVTYYKSADQLPPFDDYDMKGRTYRYFTGIPLYPFGYGLSYTTFSYSDLRLDKNAFKGDSVKINVNITNTGNVDGDEVVQLYLKDEKASTPRPVRQLEGFKRIHLNAGETKSVEFILSPRQFSMINASGKRVIEPGWFTISVGGKQPGFTDYLDAPSTDVKSIRIQVKGKTEELNEL